jgi:hypothetical protein
MNRKLIGIITATLVVGAVGAVAWANVADEPPSTTGVQVTTPSTSDDTSPASSAATTPGSQPSVTVTTTPGSSTTPTTGSSTPNGTGGGTTPTTVDDNGGNRGSGSEDSGDDQGDDHGGNRGSGSDDSGGDD